MDELPSIGKRARCCWTRGRARRGLLGLGARLKVRMGSGVGTRLRLGLRVRLGARFGLSVRVRLGVGTLAGLGVVGALLGVGALTAAAQQTRLPQAPQAALGSISGTVKDVGGSLVPQAVVTLVMQGGAIQGGGRNAAARRQTVSDSAGEFRFAGVAAGAFRIAIAENGLEPETVSGTLRPGEAFVVAKIALAIAPVSQSVSVTASRYEVAEAEIHAEEHQRVLGIVPNFFVSYVADPAPLKAKQKFKLSFKVITDPTTFLFAGITAGIEQGLDTFPGYGTDSGAFGERYGAALANATTATVLRGAALPSLLHQDPRYIFKGSGSKVSRTLYALSTAVRCKGDNGRWEPNYSSMGGNLAAGAIANAYYPPGSRHGVALTFEDGLLNIAGVAVGHVVQEFLFLKLTPHAPRAQAVVPVQAAAPVQTVVPARPAAPVRPATGGKRLF